MYAAGADERDRLGRIGREYALTEYSIERMVADWDATLTKTIDAWKNEPKRRWRQTVL
jgi:hypothetical protein